MYDILYQKKAIKALTKINEPYYSAIINAIDNLAENPRPFGYKKLTARNAYRIRIGTYRVIYEIIDTQLIVEIINVGSRGNIYED